MEEEVGPAVTATVVTPAATPKPAVEEPIVLKKEEEEKEEKEREKGKTEAEIIKDLKTQLK